MSISKIFRHKIFWMALAVLMLASTSYLGTNLLAIKSNLTAVKERAELSAYRVDQIEKALETSRSRVKELEAVEKRSKDDIKNYILTYYKTVAPTIAEEIATQIMNKSDEHNVPFVALVAVTEAESNFNPFAVSPLKKDPGRGLLQVRYGRWAEKLGLKDQYQLHDIETGVDAGAQILRQLLDDNGGDMKKALWNYVGVTNNVDLGKKYVRQIYENMGNFTVFRSLANQKPEESDSGTSSNVESGPKTYTKPTIGDPGSLPTSVASAKSTGYVLYNIEKGDTLFDIAAKYYNDGNKWKRILDANPGVEELKLVVGSKLMIPNANLNSFRGQNEPN